MRQNVEVDLMHCVLFKLSVDGLPFFYFGWPSPFYTCMVIMKKGVVSTFHKYTYRSLNLTCICMDSFTRGGTCISLISYRKQRIPHSSEAWLMEWTMLALRHSLSLRENNIPLYGSYILVYTQDTDKVRSNSMPLPWTLCPVSVCPVLNAWWSVPAVWQHIQGPQHHN